MDIISEIKKSWEDGKPILLFDSEDREGEVDIMLPSEIMTQEIIAEMRVHAGGLICCALSSEYCDKIGLPFLVDIFTEVSTKFPSIAQMLEHGLPYGARSSFSIYLNHVNSFTGITDVDRSMTIKEIGRLASSPLSDELKNLFLSKFRIPGHVPLLRGAEGLLTSRLGHTELGLALCEMTGYSNSITMCEMMDSSSGKALPIADAKQYAKSRGYIYLSGEQVIEAWIKFKGISPDDIFRRSRDV